jgi:hypothetical protein
VLRESRAELCWLEHEHCFPCESTLIECGRWLLLRRARMVRSNVLCSSRPVSLFIEIEAIFTLSLTALRELQGFKLEGIFGNLSFLFLCLSVDCSFDKASIFSIDDVKIIHEHHCLSSY